MSDRYKLDGNRNPVPFPNLVEWAKWIETDTNRQIRYEKINGVVISTVFLGLITDLAKALRSSGKRWFSADQWTKNQTVAPVA